MESSGPKRRFPAPWHAVETAHGYEIQDSDGRPLAHVYGRDDLRQWSFASGQLTLDEARRIANAIARIPEFLAQRRGFYPRGEGVRWKSSRPYHVALEDGYIRSNWGAIDAICKLNSIPFNATGEKIQNEGCWCVYEFTWQLDAILFWNRFQGRWLRGSEFHYPERPTDLPDLKEPKFSAPDARRKPPR